MKNALEVYSRKEKKQFPLQHCWDILNKHPKWSVDYVGNDIHDDDESVPETQNMSETQNISGTSSSIRPIGTKMAKERKRKGKGIENSEIVSLTEEAKVTSTNFLAYKETLEKQSDRKLMMIETSKIQTPARREWIREQQNEVLAKWAAHSLQFEEDVYRPTMPSDDSW
jgi:hypothetical protein